MKMLFAKLNLGVLALLFSSVGMAVQVTVTASNLTPLVGSTFTMTLSGDVPNAYAASIDLAFNPTKVAYVSGIGLDSFSVYVKDSPAAETPTRFFIKVPSGYVDGQQNYAQLTFLALAAGSANIVFSDDGGNSSGWPDFFTSTALPVNYTQANVLVSTPIPPAVWLFGSALGLLGSIRRRQAMA